MVCRQPTAFPTLQGRGLGRNPRPGVQILPCNLVASYRVRAGEGGWVAWVGGRWVSVN